MDYFRDEIVHELFAAFFYWLLPALILWGWVRWARQNYATKSSSKLFFVGLMLATVSALLAGLGIWYARSIGGFPYYDPRLMRIYRGGLLLSLGGVILWLRGLFLSFRTPRTPSVLRWIALISTAGTLLFWFFTAMGE